MKKSFIAFSIIGPFLLGISNPMKADDWDHWGFKINSDLENYDIYTINSKNGSSTLRTSTSSVSGLSCGSMAQCKPDIQKSYVNSTNGELVIKFSNHDGVYYGYDINSDSWSQANTFSSNFLNSDFIKRELVTGDNLGNVSFQAGGENIISKKSDGSVHIGKNSAVFKEENGREKFWAQDANGKSIPIDITNGSKLLINGRDIEQSINNVGALSAALTGLPTITTETKLACGLGTGTHGGDFAFSGGCASKVNEKLSFNYAASMTMPGQDYAGNFEDKFSARAGFVWKLGEANKSTQISLKQKKEIDLKISKLENDNELLKADNQELMTKNNEIISQNSKLLARLEKLENIAFKFQKEDKFKLSKSISE